MHLGLWEWPQFLVIGLMSGNLLFHLVRDGQPTGWNYDFGGKLLGVIVMCGILYFGGFFK
jgi:hypothetical protein